MRWKKIFNRFINTYDSKVYVLNLLPWGALGFIDIEGWQNIKLLRILWLFKLIRIRAFLIVFEYRVYQKFFRSFFHARMVAKFGS